MNRRQQPAPPTPIQRQRPAQQQQQQQQQQPRQQQQQQQPRQQQHQEQSYNQIPSQVSIPQAISILVSRINFLETKIASSVAEVPTAKFEEMTNRIVKLELELLNATNHIMKLQPDFADLTEDV